MIITLDEIIPYQPPLPPKPSISSQTILPPSKLPPLIHPLPQKPHSRHQSPLYASQLRQSRRDSISSPINEVSSAGVPSYRNVFDSELAAWSEMAVETTAVVSAAMEDRSQQPQCRSGSGGLENDLRKPLSVSQIDNGQHGSDDGEASPGISAGFLEHERSCSAYQETTELFNNSESNSMHAALSSDSRSGKAIPTVHFGDMNLPHASSAAINPPESPNFSLLAESVDKNQSILSEKQTPDPDSSPLDMILSETQETSLVVRNNDSEGIPSSFESEHSTIATDPSPSSCGERNGVCLRESNTVAVVIPAAQTPKPRTKKAAERPHRRRPKRQTTRTAPVNENDDSNNSDDDSIERTPQFDNRYRPTKNPRQLPIANSGRSDVEAVVGFQLGGLSLPDLSTVSQGRLTCDIESSHVVYTFSWLEKRQCLDRLSAKDDLPNRGYNRHDMNTAQEWESRASSKDETDEMSCNIQQDGHLSAREAGPSKPLKRNREWTPEADARLKQLRDKDKLPWSRIQKVFPNRTEGAIKARYYTVLKNSSRAPRDRGSSVSPSPQPVLQNRTQYVLDTATERTSRSRPARARRAVERFSP